jgi:hypothetical protein
MNTFKVAHIREQGIDLIIVPLSQDFQHKSDEEQQDTISALQVCASNAGLAGTVVPVWRHGASHRFICPENWTPFFKTFTWNNIMSNINKELTCG